MASYLLSRHVYVCRADDYVVLLDLRRNKYLAVGENPAAQLASLVQGWPAADIVEAKSPPPADSSTALLQRILQQGLVTRDSARGKSATPISYSPANSTLTDLDPDSQVRLNTRRVINFLVAAAMAAMSLRFRSMESIVNLVKKRKERCATRAAPFNLEAARDSVLAFERLRPLVFGSHDECLFHSLTLIEFLARERIYPTWLFGVKTGPFGAHSWVQEGEIVFNDLAEQARRFTPILAI